MTWRSFDGDWTVLAQEVAFPRDLGGRKARYLLVGYKGTIVFQTVRYKLGYADLVRDPKSSKGYRYPRTVRIQAKGADRTLSLSIRGKLRHRKDLLASAGAAKSIIGRFVAPVGYYFDAEYDLRVALDDGTTYEHKGSGEYVFKQDNP